MMSEIAALYPDHLAALGAAYNDVLTHHALDAIVLCAGAPALKNPFDDQYRPLTTTPAFAHWLPLPEPNAVLVVSAGARPRLVRVVSDDYWETPATAESTHFWSGFDVVEVRAATEIPMHLPSGRVAVVSSGELPFLPPGGTNPPELIAALHATRTHKTAYEIACLAEASRRAVRGHRAAAERFQEDAPSELALHLAYLAASDQDADDTPYKNIVARGPHAAVLHHMTYARTAPINDTDSLLVDAGASYLGYGSDITRTWVRGESDGATLFRALVAGLDKLQQTICAEITPGMEYEALHDRAHDLLAGLLVELGVGRAAPATLVERGVTRALFPHGLGHSLGVQVHDVGMKPRAPRADNPFLRNTSVIEVGQVFTIEPGCYVIDGLLAPLRADDRADLVDWKVIDTLRPFGGVRIEDDVVVGPSGIRNLTREAWGQA
jgi:Xaa-Pro dipeptidase